MCNCEDKGHTTICGQSKCPKIESILRDNSVITHFQPIVSINKAKIAGYEALSRGFCTSCNKIMMPNVIFNDHTAKEVLCELDNLCKKTALTNFKEIEEQDDEQLLFLNFDVSYMSKPEIFLQLFDGFNVNPGRIVVEIIESKVEQIDLLVKFASICREHGFLIALDDVGAGHSNFDRISLIRPDIIKIDRGIIQDIDKDFFKQEVLKSLVSLSKRIGCIVLTEGIETEEEALQCIELGSEFLQGYFFLRPQAINNQNTDIVKDKIAVVANKFKEDKLEKIKCIKKLHVGLNAFIKDMSAELAKKKPEEFEEIIKDRIPQNPFIEAICVINETGFQVTDTILNYTVKNDLKISKVSSKGTSHEYKENFYLLSNGLFERFTTEQYLSLNTGRLCKTTSVRFQDEKGNIWIISLEIHENFKELKTLIS